MARDMNPSGTSILRSIEEKDWTNAKTLFAEVAQNAYPKNRWGGIYPVVDRDYLIDVTEYDKEEDPATVPNEEKVFLKYQLDKNGNVKAEEMSYNKLMEDAAAKEGIFAKPEKPKLGFFAWLRHQMAGIFGEPDAIRKYDRQMEVYEAKKADVLNSKYGYKPYDYDADLANEKKARAYVTTGNKNKVTGGPQDQEDKKEPIRDPQKMDRDERTAMLAKTFLHSINSPFTERLEYLIDDYAGEIKNVVDMLANFQMNIDPPENSKIPKMREEDAADLRHWVGLYCASISYINPSKDLNYVKKIEKFAPNLAEANNKLLKQQENLGNNVEQQDLSKSVVLKDPGNNAMQPNENIGQPDKNIGQPDENIEQPGQNVGNDNQHRQKMDRNKTQKDLAKQLLNSVQEPGTKKLADLIDEDKEMEYTRDLVEILSNIQMHIDPPEGSGINKLRQDQTIMVRNILALFSYSVPVNNNEQQLRSFALNAQNNMRGPKQLLERFVSLNKSEEPDLGHP